MQLAVAGVKCLKNLLLFRFPVNEVVENKFFYETIGQVFVCSR